MMGNVNAANNKKINSVDESIFKVLRLTARNMVEFNLVALDIITCAKQEYSLFIKELITQWYPSATCIRLVQDNLNTHSAGSFYEVFSPVENIERPRLNR